MHGSFQDTIQRYNYMTQSSIIHVKSVKLDLNKITVAEVPMCLHVLVRTTTTILF